MYIYVRFYFRYRRVLDYPTGVQPEMHQLNWRIPMLLRIRLYVKLQQ